MFGELPNISGKQNQTLVNTLKKSRRKKGESGKEEVVRMQIQPGYPFLHSTVVNNDNDSSIGVGTVH
jgi:hypothetical protein